MLTRQHADPDHLLTHHRAMHRRTPTVRTQAGWKQSFILSSGSGINDGMQAWGDRMLKFTGKPRADMYKDQTHSTIGFWTDNGGYYHYATDAKKDTCVPRAPSPRLLSCLGCAEYNWASPL
jgi:hypothetical protein